jgi:hypothetical protein
MNVLCVPLIPHQLAAGPARRRAGQLRFGFFCSISGTYSTCPGLSKISDGFFFALYWVLPVYVELIRAVWADDRDRPLLF